LFVDLFIDLVLFRLRLCAAASLLPSARGSLCGFLLIRWWVSLWVLVEEATAAAVELESTLDQIRLPPLPFFD
jgi:hypothetical protein